MAQLVKIRSGMGSSDADFRRDYFVLAASGFSVIGTVLYLVWLGDR